MFSKFLPVLPVLQIGLFSKLVGVAPHLWSIHSSIHLTTFSVHSTIIHAKVICKGWGQKLAMVRLLTLLAFSEKDICLLIILQSAHRIVSTRRIHGLSRQCPQNPCPVRSLRLVLNARR